MRPRTIFSHLLTSYLLLLVVVFAVVVAAFAAGMHASLSVWSSNRSERLEERVGEELRYLLRREPSPDPLDVESALRGLLSPGLRVTVYHANGLLLFNYERGEAFLPGLMRMDPRTARGPFPGMRRTPNAPMHVEPRIDPRVRADLTAVEREADEETDGLGASGESAPREADNPVGLLFSAQSEGFIGDETNRMLLSSIVRALSLGVAAATLAAFAIALLSGRRFSAQTRSLSTALRQIASGRRDVGVTTQSVFEFGEIADAASALQRRLTDDESARAQWAQDVAHDLRTPVTALRSQLEAMRDGVLPADARHVEIMLAEVDRAQRLVEDLGQLSHLESPEMSLQETTWDARTFAQELVDAFRIPAADRAITVESVVESVVESPTLSGDRALLMRACSNLLDNAIRYCTVGGTVSLRAQGAASSATFAVTNDGQIIGDPERLFARLARGDASRSSRGSGLGLTIARTIARLHGGTLTLANDGAAHVTAVLTVPALTVPAEGHPIPSPTSRAGTQARPL